MAEAQPGPSDANAEPNQREGLQEHVVQVEYNASNYGARKRSNKKQNERDAMQEGLLAELCETNAQLRMEMQSPPTVEEDEVDLQMQAMVKKIKRNLDYVQQEDVMEEIQAVVSRHVKQAHTLQHFGSGDRHPTSTVTRSSVGGSGAMNDLGYMPQGPMVVLWGC